MKVQSGSRGKVLILRSEVLTEHHAKRVATRYATSGLQCFDPPTTSTSTRMDDWEGTVR